MTSKLIDAEQFDLEISELLHEETPVDVGKLEDELVSKIPDKFKGKSLEEVVDSYTNLEKELGRKNNEVGELRKLADDYIKRELSTPPKQETKPKIDQERFYEDPDSEIEKVLNHRLKETEARIAELNRTSQLKDFEAKHPTWMATSQTPEFEAFVQASPLRQRLYAQANQFDLAAADDLFTLYNEVSSAKAASIKEVQAEQKKEGLKQASSETGSSGGNTRKIYKRSELIRLKVQNPAKYASMQDEITLAYMENRVK